MSFTSNSWKQSGGLNRNKQNQNIKANQMAPSNLNITEKLGVETSITPLISNLESSTSSFLYNFQNGKNFNNNIAYYPFNQEINTIGISNESLNPLLYTPSNFDLNYQGGGSYLSLVSSPFNQSATQFSQNAKTLISDFSYNTQNVFGIDPGNSISYAITVASYIYVSSEASNFCFFAMDNLNQDALTNNGNITTGISNESFYLWYPDNEGKATVYYTTINPASGATYGLSSQIDIVLYDQWHALTLSLNGNYIYINLDGKTVFNQPVSVGTKVPNQPIAINLSSKSYDSINNTVISNGSTNSGNIQLLDYNIFNFAVDPVTVNKIKDFRDNIQNINNSNLPNRNLYLNYTIGEDINYLSSKIIAGNGIGNNGSLTNFGEFNNFSRANFYDTTTFYGNVLFDSSTSLVYDSSLNSSLEIYTLPGKAGTVTSSFLIENAGAVPGNSFNPTMVVYNGTSTQINPPLPTQGLVFSISGENVSVGDIFGSHTFDVSGTSYLKGFSTIHDNQNNGYGSYAIGGNNPIGSLILRNEYTYGNPSGNNGGSSILFAGPSGHGNDFGAIGWLDNVGTNNQSFATEKYGASYNYFNSSGSENGCLYLNAQNDGKGSANFDQMVLRSSGYIIIDTGGYLIDSTNTYPSPANHNAGSGAAIGGNISILPNGGAGLGIGTLRPNYPTYILDVSGNTTITGSLELSGNKINITNSTNNSSIAIGNQAGQSDQSANSIAIGEYAGYSNQDGYSIAIGYQAGQSDQSANSIAIGQYAGNSNQSFNSIAMGSGAGYNNQNQYSIAIGYGAGNTYQNQYSIAIGTSAGDLSQNPYSIAMGYTAGEIYQNEYSIAIGPYAGQSSQNNQSIAIGNQAGNSNQNQYSIAIGASAGYQDQNQYSIAMGYQAGNTDQSGKSIAMGYQAGQTSQNEYSIAIGALAGNSNQSANSIAIGQLAGSASLGQNSIAIGYNTVNQYTTSVALGAGATTTANNQIVLGTTSETVFIPGNLNISGNLSANNVGPSSDNRLLANVASQWIQSAGSISQLNMNGYMFTRAILNYGEINDSPTGLIFGTGANTNQSDYLSLVTGGETRLYILPGGTVGINTTNPNNSYALDVYGNINVTGSITSTGTCSCSSYNTTSDLRLKENITELDNSLEKICNIRGVSYNLKSDENKTKTSGVIAQEVIEHIPEAVNNMDSEKLSVNYNSIIAHLIESVKELKREIEELKSKN